MNRALLPVTMAFMLFGSHCTGMNIGTWLGTTANTNPAREYTNFLPVIFRGGGLIHMNYVAGQLGQNVENPTKTGESCSHSVLWLVAFGDSSILKAKKKAEITQIAFVDYRIFSVLGFVYHKFCTRVRGS